MFSHRLEIGDEVITTIKIYHSVSGRAYSPGLRGRVVKDPKREYFCVSIYTLGDSIWSGNCARRLTPLELLAEASDGISHGQS